MESEYERSRIERAKRGLYSPNPTEENHDFSPLTPVDVDVHENWKDQIDPRSTKKSGFNGVVLLKTLIVVVVLVFIGAVSFFAYTVWDPFSKPSDKNIVFNAELPVAVSSGAISPVRLGITNNNRVPLEYAVITVIYPPGTKSGSDVTKDMRDDKKTLGEIASGALSMYDQRVVFLGEENSQQEIRFKLEYRFKGINSIFTKEETRPLRLTSAPVNLVVNTLTEINSGQTLELEIVATSNTVVPLSNVIITVEYPQGFVYKDANVKPTSGNNVWNIGQLKSGDKQKIRIRGLMTGEPGGQKVFQTKIGVPGETQSNEVSTEYGSTFSTVTIRESFVGIDLLLDSKSVGDTIANFGKRINGTINWKNNLEARIANVEIELRLRGTALNRLSITPENGGFYRSSDDTVFWDQRGDQRLEILDVNESGTTDFSFLPLPPIDSVTGKTIKNPEIVLEISVRGQRLSESGVPEEVKTVSIRTVKVTSNVQLASNAVYSVGPIVNRGPIPPKVDQETTYTIRMSIINTSNDIANTVVRAVVPPYARFTGTVMPAKENIVYNPSTKEIIWSPGSVPAGTGVSTAAKEVYFQMLIVPSLSQLRKSPVILLEQELQAQDAYTGELVTQTHNPLDVSLTNDPKYSQNDGLVVP